MLMMNKKGLNTFKSEWLMEPIFKDWLISDASQVRARCKLCAKSFDVGNMGRAALTSHRKGEKHRKLEQEKKSTDEALTPLHFFGTTPVASNKSVESSAASVPSCIEFLQIPIAVQHAEIRYALKVVMSHSSFRSCEDINELFQAMFTDSVIASKFHLGKTKCMYTICYGIAPYFKKVLESQIRLSPFFSVCFDESLNSILQEEQMDILIRFWDDAKCEAVTRYWDSQFMHNPNADNLVGALYASLNEAGKLPIGNWHHLSMDGPRTNWAVLDKIQAKRTEREELKLEVVGSCSLHVVSGALQTGLTATTWKVDKILKSMWRLFYDSPARRSNYIRINTTEVFPLSFCKTRWVENEDVTKRAYEVWDNVVNVIKYYEGLSQSKRPKNNKSYALLAQSYTDKLMKFKFQMFNDLASILNTFLVSFQTDAPMIPFMSDAVEKIMRRLMKMFLLTSVVENASTPYKLIKIDVDLATNRLPVDQMKLPTATNALLKSSDIIYEQKSKLRKECRTLLSRLVAKLQERSPLQYVIVRVSAALSPVNMLGDKEASIIKFNTLVDKLYSHERLNSVQADAAKAEYEDFLSIVVMQNMTSFEQFKPSETRLDTFLGRFLAGESKYQHVWLVCKFIFTISHGQAQIERGFSVNKEMLVENLQKTSLKSLKFVYDHVISVGTKIQSFDISSELSLSCKGAHMKYKLALEQQQKIHH